MPVAVTFCLIRAVAIPPVRLIAVVAQDTMLGVRPCSLKLCVTELAQNGFHETLFHMYTVIYGWRLALVPLEPVELIVIPVVADAVIALLKVICASSDPSERIGALPGAV